MFTGTWWSLMPPVVAIVLALLTKEVYISLFAGCALGALLAANFHPWAAFDTLFHIMIDSVDFSILMFMILLGMIVMLMQESGGTRAYGEWASKRLKSKRAALVATSLLGVLIFVDDYFNCLTVGSVMRPVTDKYKISRAKLAYIIDATAAPVCIIAPISSWAAAVNSYVPKNSSMSGFQMFVSTIPFNLYAILTLYMVFFTSIAGFDFGLMKVHEKNAAKGDLFTSGGEAFQNQEKKDPTEGGKYAKGKVSDLILPMLVMIGTAIGCMIWTGHLNGGKNLIEDFANCSSSESLVFAGLITVAFLLIYYLPRRVIGFKDFMNSVPEGGKLMMPAILILTLAWTLKGTTDKLGLGDFVRNSINLSSGWAHFIPVIIFLIAVFIAFSSGTSWGTFAILVPIVVNMFSKSDETMMILSVAAVLAGAVCGDHVSPISDTTIMSSSGAQSNHINHVQTQMQYALVVVAVCVVGYIIGGFTENWVITLASSLMILTIVLLIIRKRSLAEDRAEEEKPSA
jgi:tetracycline resistance efflux pump